MKQQRGITIFSSYALADQVLYDRFSRQLSPLQREGLIEEWHLASILAGTDCMLELDRMLRSAQVILLFISADFLASDDQYQLVM